MQMTRWRLAVPACALAATLAVGACGRDNDGDGNHWAGKPDSNGTAVERDGDATAPAAGADVQDTDRTNSASGMVIDLFGCVRRAAPGSARYVLSDVRTGGMASEPGAVGTTGTAGEPAGGSSDASDRYDLVARSGQDLGEHVGRRVKVTGRLATPTAYTDQASREAVGTTGSDMPSTHGNETSAASRTLHVSNVQRFGGEHCSTASPGE